MLVPGFVAEDCRKPTSLKSARREAAFPEVRELSKQLRVLAGADPELPQYLEESARLAARLAAGIKPKLSLMAASR